MLFRCIVIVGFVFCSFLTSESQDDLQLDRGVTGLARSLSQLQTTASVMHVVAHPDDEDGPLLAYCARGLGVRTLLFSITRGEGGANLISSFFFDELGALRTLEHKKSAGYYGNELFYSHAADYGYSKTLDEAKRQWKDGKPILADLVEVVRREQPTIVLSRFRGDSRDGHGHHQMAGVISRAVVDAAADKQRFADQFSRGLHAWQVKKLYVNDFRWRRSSEDSDWTVKIPTGEYNPLLGRSFAQIARYGLGFQRSQGISGHWADAGARPSYYRLEKSIDRSYQPDKEATILQNIDTSISGLARLAGETPDADLVAGLKRLEANVRKAFDAFDVREPQKIVPYLLNGLEESRRLAALIDTLAISPAAKYSLNLQVNRKIGELEKSIAQATGLSLECWVDSENDQRFAVPGRSFDVNLKMVNPSPSKIDIEIASLETPDEWSVSDVTISDEELRNNQAYESSFHVSIGRDAKVTRPHWQRESIREPFYTTAQGSQQKPVPSIGAKCVVHLRVDGVRVTLTEPVMIRFRSPEFGRVRYPLATLPELSVRFPLRHGVIPLGNADYSIDVETLSTAPISKPISLRLDLPEGWTSEPNQHEFTITKANEQRVSRFILRLPSELKPGEFEIGATLAVDGRESSEGFRIVTARDLDRLALFKPAKHTIHTVDVKTSRSRKVGYIMGSGDEVPSTLAALGVSPRMLSANDLQSIDFSQFDVIIVGVRAYAVRPDIRKFNDRLMQFVKAGGVLIVQYQTPEFDNNFGPYPYKMGRRPEEVSEEDSVVSILEPTHPLFNYPNKISNADFEGWLEQRGSKFWASWDERYVPLLECHDTGQEPQTGGMLVAEYGKGVYVYSAYAWYRQLPNGVPGAYRIYANMLSLKAGQK